MPTELTLKDFEDARTLETGQRHQFTLKRRTVHVLEIEDVLFHFNSSVLMPEGIAGTGLEQNRISGLSVMRAAYIHAGNNPDHGLILAGHTDSSGNDSYNEDLSLLRGENVLHVLEGNKDGFVAVAQKKHVNEDIEHILRWVQEWLNWDCDPGSVDNVKDQDTTRATKNFQQSYSDAEFGEKISVDGVVGKQTWGAFFHLYMRRLAELLDTDEAGLPEHRGKLNWLYPDLKLTGCGEYHPVNSNYVDGLVSQTDRRVELLFHEADSAPEEKPGKICHQGGASAAKKCPLYTKIAHKFIHLVPQLIDIKKVDRNFAPGKENLDITYRIEGLSGSEVTLEIRSPLHTPEIVFSRTLTDKEKADGTHTLDWDGKTNCGSGDLKGLFVHPLFGPYDVKMHDGVKFSDKVPFDIIYDSIVLVQDSWTIDGKVPTEKNQKAQYYLNELGYYGGPVAHDVDDYLKKSLIRYKANHKQFHKLDYSDYDGSISDDLIKALEKGDNKRTWFTGDSLKDSSKSSKLYVEAITYEGKEFRDSYKSASKKKAAKESERLNRPILPIAAEIWLKDKTGKKVLAGEGVGPVRINWLFEDPDEDISTLKTSVAGEPSLTKKYVEKALKTKSGRSGNGDNCHKDFGGIREDAATNWSTPAILGTALEGYDVKKDTGQKCLYSLACTDKVKYPSRFGKAGLMFRPSFVGGDDFKIKAELDFTDLPNKAALETLHGITDRASRPHAESGRITIWRRAKVSVLVNWPARSAANPWAAISKEFADAYLELDVSSIASKKVSEILTAAEYKEIVSDKTSHKKKDIKLLDNSFCGVKLPKQGSMAAGAYRAALRTFTYDDYWNKIIYPLREKVSEKVRKDYPTGFILVDFMTHLPVDIQAAPPGNKSVVNAGYITWASSIGLPDSCVFADQKDPDKVYYVVAHEFGHNFWLKHWEHAGGSQASSHDVQDHNCIMSYSNQKCTHVHHRQGVYTPHFCGKCNVKLRGWNIDAAGVPADSS